MVQEAIVAGSARAIGAAFQAGVIDTQTCAGAVLVGAGDAPIEVVSRATNWRSLSLPSGAASALLLAEPPANGSVARAILEQAAAAGMKVFLLEHGGVRPLRLHDLLGAPLRAVDWQRIRAIIAGKRVLITGGGGSIGGELARRIAELEPARLTLLDSSEHNIYQIGLELREARTVLCDVRDEAAVRRWFATESPEIVFHTAALKQVPVVEAFPSEGVLTNVCGLRNVAEAAHWAGADLIFVSTDKAVDPSGVMGATKRLGELYCQAIDGRGGRRAFPVRLGNVLGSAGSVSPLFEAQVAAGGPLTVTHPAMTRYFMSIPQAADALLQAAARGLASSRRGAVKVIEMGEALPVVELARNVIRLAGKRPDEDVAVVYTGLRPGEKLHEQLMSKDEWLESEPGAGVVAVMSEPRDLAELQQIIDHLTLLARQGADEDVRKLLFDAVAPLERPQDLAVAG